jgi:4-amino-4-deoxychorismate lyase
MTAMGNVVVNGEATEYLSAYDRGLHYGDGLFETIAVLGGQPRNWELHLERLRAGCERLRIPPPSPERLFDDFLKLPVGDRPLVLKIIVTRGAGGRGYRPPENPSPTRILTLGPWPDHPPANREQGVTVRLCELRLGSNPALAGLKHLNRLEQVLARGEWSDPAIAEGLMFDANGYLVEGTMSNVFICAGGEIHTPLLDGCGVAGIVRRRIIERAAAAGSTVRERRVTQADLLAADAVFLTNSLIGLWPVRRVLLPEGSREYDSRPVVDRLRVELGME